MRVYIEALLKKFIPQFFGFWWNLDILSQHKCMLGATKMGMILTYFHVYTIKVTRLHARVYKVIILCFSTRLSSIFLSFLNNSLLSSIAIDSIVWGLPSFCLIMGFYIIVNWLYIWYVMYHHTIKKKNSRLT